MSFERWFCSRFTLVFSFWVMSPSARICFSCLFSFASLVSSLPASFAVSEPFSMPSPIRFCCSRSRFPISDFGSVFCACASCFCLSMSLESVFSCFSSLAFSAGVSWPPLLLKRASSLFSLVYLFSSFAASPAVSDPFSTPSPMRCC